MKHLLFLFFAFTLVHAAEDAGTRASDRADSEYILGGLEQPDQETLSLVQRRSGEKVDPREGAILLWSAAEQGDVGAQANLGFAYMRGLGVPLDYGKAREWSRKAAEAGDPTAHVNLAYLYARGFGGEKSYLLAYKHYFIAAFTSPPGENFLRGRWYEQERMARNPPLTILFYATAASQGHGGAVAALIRYLAPVIVLVIFMDLLLARVFFRLWKNRGHEGPFRQCLSSRWTPFYKFGMSSIWLCGLAGIVLLIGLGALDDFVVKEIAFAHGRWVLTLLGAATSLFIGRQCLALKKVALDSEGFHISNYLRTIHIPVGKLSRVSGSLMISPEMIWLEFREDTGFGRRIVFMPPRRFAGLFTRHPLVAQLKVLTVNENGDKGADPFWIHG